ncbi:MAG: prolipoprotein diacylglyceryl transferase [Ruminococcaceae bacterium]|nr:prolipoprotein diacylglyceryl transferase [Oscillospiraceae bacterium]
MTMVSFPGLFGSKIFSIDPVAFRVFGLEVRWYGLIICAGIILAVLNTIRCAKKEGITTDDVLDYAIWVVPGGIIGARLYYVLTSLSEYHSIGEAIAIWNGGLAIYGGVIGGALAVFIVSKVKKINFLKMADAIATSLLIGQLIGRWGNFCNGEAYGSLEGIDLLGRYIATPGLKDDYFLRMVVNSDASFGTEIVHPTFLYESIWNIIGLFVITFFVYRVKKFDGQVILAYLAWYGFGRFFIEGLRTDSLYLGNTGIRISQLLALLTFVFAITTTIIMLIRHKKGLDAEKEYVSQFGVSKDTIAIIPGTDSVNDDNIKTTDETNNDTDAESEEKTSTEEK